MNVKAAIIGMGIGKKHLEAIDHYKNSEVKVICEKDPKKIKSLKKKFKDKIITNKENDIFKSNEINLVSIASYDNFHFNQIIKCIKSNKNIIVEKPMCMNLDQLKLIFKLLKQNKKVKMTSNLVLRTTSLFKSFKKKINTNDLYYVEGDYIWGRRNKLYGWRSKIKNYSVTLGAGIHMIDLIMWLTQLKPKSVTAHANKKVTSKSKFKKNSFVIMIFSFPKNILVKITANTSAVFKHFHELKLFSKHNTLINNISGSYLYKNDKLVKSDKKYPDKVKRKKLIQNFIDHLKNKNIKPLMSLKEQIDLMTVCFAVDESIKKGKKIKINYIK